MEGRKGGREKQLLVCVFYGHISFFFFSLGVGVMQAMDYSNQSEKSVGFIHTLIPFG